MSDSLTKGIGHTEFKNSPMGKIPVDWEIVLGSKNLTLGSGFSPSLVEFSDNGNCLFMKVDDYNNSENLRFIIVTKLSFNKFENKKIPIYSKGTIVIAKRGAAIFKNRVKIFSRETSVDTNLMTIQTGENFNTVFFRYYLEYFNLEKIADTTSIPQINNFHLYDMAFPKPPIHEQQKIAKILTSVDEVIEATETQINKLKDLKKGMMNELLTKGIGHTEFKDSAVGRIPVEWEVKEFQEVSNVIDSLHQTPVFSSTGFPMVRVSDIKQGKIKLEYTQKVKEDVFLQFTKKYLPVLGDLLISRVGSYGVCSIVDTEQQFCLGQNTAIIHPTTVLSKFLYYWIYSPSIFEQVENEVAGSSYKSLSLATIRKLNIAIPSKLEQEKIANIIWSIDTNIEQKQTKLTQSKNLKKSLMADLLTGKVRVKPNQELTELS